jgi:ribosomal protein S30
MKPRTKAEAHWRANYFPGNHNKRGYKAWPVQSRLAKFKMGKARRQTDKLELIHELEEA